MSDPQLSPDGKGALVVVTDATAEGGKNHVWLVEVNGGAPRQLTFSSEAEKGGQTSPRWMPDGQSILFLAHRGERTGLFRLPMNGGEAKALEVKVLPAVDESKAPGALPPGSHAEDKPAELPLDVESYAVSPDGRFIALRARDPQTPGEKKQKDEKADAEWVDHDEHHARLYLLDPASGKVATLPVPVDVEGFKWSPDGKQLVVVVTPPNHAADLGPANALWVVTMGEPPQARAVAGPDPSVEDAAWSWDASAIVYYAQAKRDAPPGYVDLYVFDTGTRTARNLSEGFDGSLGRTAIPLKGGGVLQMVQTGVEQAPARYGAGRGPDRLKMPAAVVSAVNTNATQGGWLFLGSSGGRPPELDYAPDLDTAPRRLETPSLVPERTKSTAPRRIEWKNEGLTIQGLLYLPEPTSGRVPLVVEVHGGPTGAYVDRFDPFVDFLLGHGWAVLRTNPRGSTGRGAAFAAANKNDLGGADFRDIMAGVDYALKTEPLLDGGRMALMGYSYGGEMAGFVEGKTTRFKAIVSGAPVIDQYSEYGTEDGSWYDRWFYGKPWEHPADAWRQSPLAGAGAAKTPFLLLQGQGDKVDPLGQAQEMYRALRQMGVKVDLVTYPREDHGPLARGIYGSPSAEPWHGFDARQRLVSFLEAAFKGAP
jgi:dipeptidyl aminopeptidase/acylaminoacyl peptidase